MQSLAELQQAMRAEVLGSERSPAAPALAALILSDGLTVERRLDVHRNNTLASLTSALAEAYPVIRRLVGEGFFAGAARAYVRHQPPCEARLSYYGDGFAAFLAGYPPARGLPYLADVARLEWAVNESFYAAEAPPLDPARLAALSPAESAGLRLALHPSCRLVASPYPVERIWRANQPDGDAGDTIDLGAGACRLLVRRDGFDLRFAALDAGGFALLAVLARGETLGAAYGAATAEQPDFDLATALQRHIAAGLFVGMDVPEIST